MPADYIDLGKRWINPAVPREIVIDDLETTVTLIYGPGDTTEFVGADAQKIIRRVRGKPEPFDPKTQGVRDTSAAWDDDE